jgi:hypothetical protein
MKLESPFQFAGAIVVQLGNYAVENIETIVFLALQDVTIKTIYHHIYGKDTRKALLISRFGVQVPGRSQQIPSSDGIFVYFPV